MKKWLLTLLLLAFFLPGLVSAQPLAPGVGTNTGTNQTTVDNNKCDPNAEADTALGCIPTDPAELVKWVLKYAILIGGGLAFMLSVWGGATILLSSGNPEKLNEGRQIITSAISGLLFIILSVFLLRLIGVNILGLPGFSG